MTGFVRPVSALLLSLTCIAAEAKPLPEMKFRDLAGHPQKFSSLRGSVTVISFWATWCAPCREELPRLSQLQQQYAAKGVRFLAISIDDPRDRAKIEPYLRQQNVTLDVWVGADVDAMIRLGLHDIVPGTIVVDKDGEIAGRIMGEARDADVSGYVDWLLSGRQGQAPEPLLKRY